MEAEVIRSNRKTISLEIREGRLIVRAPMYATTEQINDLIQRHKSWIERHLAETQAQKEAADNVKTLTYDELRELGNKALEIIPARVRYYAPLIGVTYRSITIRNQRTKWGSCSAKGNLNFNCLLVLAPPEVLDSVVVHELCHRKELNHSKRFYAEVLRVFPDYYKCWDWLKKNGSRLISMMPK